MHAESEFMLLLAEWGELLYFNFQLTQSANYSVCKSLIAVLLVPGSPGDTALVASPKPSQHINHLRSNNCNKWRPKDLLCSQLIFIYRSARRSVRKEKDFKYRRRNFTPFNVIKSTMFAELFWHYFMMIWFSGSNGSWCDVLKVGHLDMRPCWETMLCSWIMLFMLQIYLFPAYRTVDSLNTVMRWDNKQ